MTDLEFKILTGKILTSISGKVGDGDMLFVTDTGEKFMLTHYQSCCESVYIEDICGDLNDLLGSPILLSEEVTSNENPEGVTKDYQDSFTWTFYKLSTIRGSVTIRWYGESNGYYSESVSFTKVNP